MKKVFTIALTLLSISVLAQVEPPKEGAELYVQNPKVVLEKDLDYSFDIQLVRSNRARKAKFEIPQIKGPKGIEFTVEQSEENMDLYKVHVNAKNIEPGKYFYLVTSKGKGIQKAKGLSMSFEVAESASVANAN